MLPSGLLDHPACASIAHYLARLSPLVEWPSVAALNDLFADRLGLEPAVLLEAQAPRRARRESIYEVRIHAQRRIPTRQGSWHDLMNALVWASFPRSKRALSARQHAIVTARIPPDATRLPGTRTREQDALAMMDEGGAVLVVHAGDDVDLEWPESIRVAIVERRVVLRLFGHGLLEAVATGELERRDLRAAVEIVRHEDPCAVTSDELDALLAARIEQLDAFARPEPSRSLWLREVLRGDLLEREERGA